VSRLAVITGSGGSIGGALVSAFRQAGYATIGIDRQRSEVTDIACNLEDFHEQELLDGLRSRSALPVHTLVNNAALQIVDAFERIEPAAWRSAMEVNLIAPARLMRMLLPDLRETRGNVINIGSIHSAMTKPGFTAYATSKAAIAGLSRAAAVELGHEIRVNTIEPAAIDTPMLRAGFEGAPEGFETLENHHPSARIGTPEEVAQLAVFLASEHAAFINGAAIGIDGAIRARLHDPGGRDAIA
jgi:NAD(P)-dependent dehydrogenase (short-subunit alcohol dehydrogenase family)